MRRGSQTHSRNLALALRGGAAKWGAMRNDTGSSDDGYGVRNALTRISDALGVPAAAFYGADADAIERLRREHEAHVLRLVRAYLQEVDHEHAQRFIAAVQALAEVR